MAKRVFSQVYGVVGGLIERDGKILLIREKAGKHPDQLKWNAPGGWLDVGEEPIAGAVREIKEETGYDVEVTGIIGLYSMVREDLNGLYDFEDTPHALKLYISGEVTGGELSVNPDEIAEVKWFDPEEIFAMDQTQLRGMDIKTALQDLLDGTQYPLELVTHTIQQPL